jgi:hypothetical protein
VTLVPLLTKSATSTLASRDKTSGRFQSYCVGQADGRNHVWTDTCLADAGGLRSHPFAEASILFAKGCNVFITELTVCAWIHAQENKRSRRTRGSTGVQGYMPEPLGFVVIDGGNDAKEVTLRVSQYACGYI